MNLPYQKATSGKSAVQEIQKILQGFGCQAFGVMEDFENQKLILQFKHRNRQISIEASMAGYASLWLKEHPWSNRRTGSREEHERKAPRIASVAVYSVLRDWVKGQMTAVEAGILSFEGAFLGQILLPNGQTVLQAAQDKFPTLRLEDK